MEKEIINIEAEYRNTINNDAWKTTRAFQLITDSDSLNHRFIAGNYKTLHDLPSSLGIDVSLLV